MTMRKRPPAWRKWNGQRWDVWAIRILTRSGNESLLLGELGHPGAPLAVAAAVDEAEGPE